MSDRSSLPQRMARGLALLLSVSLGAFVVVNAQTGCDSPSSNPPASKDATKREPVAQPDAAPPAKPDSEPAVVAEPPPEPAANPAPQPANAPEPVLMPASKSGGDFGAMQFPGEQSPTQLQQNPAPQQ